MYDQMRIWVQAVLIKREVVLYHLLRKISRNDLINETENWKYCRKNIKH